MYGSEKTLWSWSRNGQEKLWEEKFWYGSFRNQSSTWITAYGALSGKPVVWSNSKGKEVVIWRNWIWMPWKMREHFTIWRKRAALEHVPVNPRVFRWECSAAGLPNHTRHSIKRGYLCPHGESPWDMEKDGDESRRIQEYRVHDFPGNLMPEVLRVVLEELFSQNCMMDAPKCAISGLHFGKFPDPDDFQCWRVNFKIEVCVYTVPSAHNNVDQLSGDGKIYRRSFDVAINWRTTRFPWFWDV